MRLAAEPGVGASFANELLGGGPDRWFEIEGGVAAVDPRAPTTRETTVRATIISVGAGFFELYDAPIVAGRGFVAADAAQGSTAVIVDRSFAEQLGGNNVVGRRIRDPQHYGSRPGDAERAPWLDIVGVVNMVSPAGLADVALPQVYSAATPAGIRAPSGAGQGNALFVVVRARGRPTPDVMRGLRDVVASVEPRFQLHELHNVGEAERLNRRTYRPSPSPSSSRR